MFLLKPHLDGLALEQNITGDQLGNHSSEGPLPYMPNQQQKCTGKRAQGRNIFYKRVKIPITFTMHGTFSEG